MNVTIRSLKLSFLISSDVAGIREDAGNIFSRLKCISPDVSNTPKSVWSKVSLQRFEDILHSHFRRIMLWKHAKNMWNGLVNFRDMWACNWPTAEASFLISGVPRQELWRILAICSFKSRRISSDLHNKSISVWRGKVSFTAYIYWAPSPQSISVYNASKS